MKKPSAAALTAKSATKRNAVKSLPYKELVRRIRAKLQVRSLSRTRKGGGNALR